MQDSELNKFVELLAGLGEIFDKKISKVFIEIYWEALKEYSLDDIKKAVNNIIKTHVYATFPKPAQFIEYIEPSEELEFKAEKGLKEWVDVYCDRGIYENVEFKDPIVAQVCQHYGGWVAICKSFPRDSDDDSIDRRLWYKDFKMIYKGYARARERQPASNLIGLHETGNTDRGYIAKPDKENLLPEQGDIKKIDIKPRQKE